jgi:hypothetical protein
MSYLPFTRLTGHLLQPGCTRLAELGSKRLVDKDGYEYWDLKPDLKPGEAVEL